MAQNIATLTLVVADYDPAINWFVEKLGFVVIEDTALSEDKRWVLIAPKDSKGVRLLLGKADDPTQLDRVGDQTGGRVFLFLETDDFATDYAFMRTNGVNFIEAPRDEPYGQVAVFEDICGNHWDLIQPKLS